MNARWLELVKQGHGIVKKLDIPTTCASVVALCMIAIGMPVKAQTAQSPGSEAVPAPPTLLDMPLVGLDEGQRFQQARSVRASSVSMKQLLPAPRAAASGPSLANVSGESLNQPEAEPILGHPLPTSAKTPLGFPRANFAIEKNSGGARAAGAAQSSTSALSNTVVK